MTSEFSQDRQRLAWRKLLTALRYIVAVILLAAAIPISLQLMQSIRPSSTSDSAMRRQWNDHANEIKALNDLMLRYWASDSNEMTVLSQLDEDQGMVFGESKTNGHIRPMRLSSADEELRLSRLMKKSGIAQAAITPEGAWYGRFGESASTQRGFFFYEGKKWAKRYRVPLISVAAQVRKLEASPTARGTTSSFIKISDGWYIYSITYRDDD